MPASASRLKTLGECPRAFFFRYLLALEPPDYHAVDPNVWLGPLERGGLLHRVFCRFMRELTAAGKTPEPGRDAGLLHRVLEEEVAAAREEMPPPSEAVFRADVRSLKLAADIFLTDGDVLLRGSTPAFFEVAVGMPGEGEPTPLDADAPVAITLPGGAVIGARGRIDRIDRDAAGELWMWDYKTGDPRYYTGQDPFRGGRQVQNALYVALLRARLAQSPEIGGGVAGFGYFFTGEKGQGRVVRWTAAELERGLEVVAALCRVAAAGAYPAVTNDADCPPYCDFAGICGRGDAADAARKTGAEGNDVLAAWRARGGTSGGE
jgi:ATP-dependent helicase/nuclease subunit B